MRWGTGERGRGPAVARAVARRSVWMGSVAAGGWAACACAAAQTAPATVELDPIEVQGQAAQPRDTPPGTTGYVATRNSTATKTSTPVREVPQSVSVVTRQQLDDRDVQTLSQAMQYTPGVTTNRSGVLSDFDRVRIRGFDAGYEFYRDGLRQGGTGFGVPRVEPYGLQGVSILRGPASGLYGLSGPGGIVDAVSKRPTATPFGELQLQLGQYDRTQGNFDFGGPVVGNEQFSYRLTGLLRESNTFLPFENDNRAYIAPAVRWQPDADTSVTVLGEYQKSRTSANSLYYTGADHKIRYYSNDPAYGAFDQEQYRLGYEVAHRFSDALTVRQNFRFYHVLADSKYTEIDAVDEATGVGSRSTGHDRDNLNEVTLDNQAEFHFRLGDVGNTLLTGLNYTHVGNFNRFGAGAAPDLDLFTLNYGAQAIAAPAAYSYIVRQTQDEVGLYAQEQARFGGFLLTLNGQQSWVSQHSESPGTAAIQQDDAAFTGRVGLSYLFNNGVTPYASYATSFAPQLGTTASGATFAPTTGQQGEIGVKYQMPTVPVLLTAALFDIVQNDVLRTDPANISFQAATGQVESRGVELEATVALAEGIDLTAAYSHLAVAITRGATDTTGNELSGIPRDSASLFAKYTFQPGTVLHGLGVGAGVRYIGTSFGDDQNTFTNKAVALMDAVVDYDVGKSDPRFKGLTLQVNATNLLDHHFQTCETGYCGRGEGQQVIGSLVYRF